MTTLKVGDIVKSLDFNGIDDCYMVGQVVGVHNDGSFRAKFMRRVWQGKIDTKFKTDYFTAPLQGEHFMDNDSMPRVSVVN
jgi:hypothetical protein